MECTTFTDRAAGARLRDGIGQAAQILARAGIDSAALDADVLLSYALGLTREQLLLRADSLLSADQADCFAALLARRLQREPMAYIIGRQEFWSLDFHVSPAVLIPRPETERLVEAALSLAASVTSTNPLRVLDLGTGSGAIAVSLATEIPAAEIIATDISPAALAVARQNARINGVAERIEFCCGDLIDALAAQATAFDLILSNPPYIRRAEIAVLEPEVGFYEPRAALDGGADGLDFYRRIAAGAWRFLAPNGALALEVGADMGDGVCAVFNQTGRYQEVVVLQDYAARDRVMIARAKADPACSG
jgi:release factor glutamine methyltransferase